MKLAILSRAPNSYSTKRLKVAALDRGNKAKVLNTLRFAIDLVEISINRQGNRAGFWHITGKNNSSAKYALSPCKSENRSGDDAVHSQGQCDFEKNVQLSGMEYPTGIFQLFIHRINRNFDGTYQQWHTDYCCSYYRRMPGECQLQAQLI